MAARASRRRTASSTMIPVTEQCRRSTGHWPSFNCRAELHLSRFRVLDGRRQPEHLSGARVLRDRRAQREGRLPGQPRLTRFSTPSRTSRCSTYRFNQGVPNQSPGGCRIGTTDDHRFPAASTPRTRWTRNRLTRAGRAPVRPGVELQPRRGQRHARSRFNAGADYASRGPTGSMPIRTSRHASEPRTTCSATARRP